MRVLHIGLSSIMGGIESFALNYFRELHKQGVVFDFVDIYGAGIAGADEIRALGGKIFTISNFKRHPLRAKGELTSLFKQSDYDSVHIHVQTAANIIPALSAQEAGVVPILHCHVTAAEGRLRSMLHNAFVKKLRSIPAIHTACGQQAGEWIWGNNNFTVIPNAVDPKKYFFDEKVRTQLRQELGISKTCKVLGFVGRLEEVKNPMFLIELAQKIQQNNLPCKIVVVGDGSLRESMQATLQQKGLYDVVTFLGYRADVDKLLSAFDIYLLPSFHEALSLSAVEAQMNGLCCLLSDSIPQENNLSGQVRFVALNDASAWLREIQTILKDGCGRSSAGFAESSPYNLTVSARNLLNLYELNKSLC